MMRECITPHEMLVVTLRYLSSGLCLHIRYVGFQPAPLLKKFTYYQRYDIFRNLTFKLLQVPGNVHVSTYLCITQYLHNAKVIGLHFHTINSAMTKLINVPTNKLGSFNLLTNYEFDSVMSIHEHLCTPYMCNERSHYDTCTPYRCTAYMYAVHVS